MMRSWVDYWKNYAKQSNPHTKDEPIVKSSEKQVEIESFASYSQYYRSRPRNRPDDPHYLSVNVNLSLKGDKLSIEYSKNYVDIIIIKQFEIKPYRN